MRIPTTVVATSLLAALSACQVTAAPAAAPPSIDLPLSREPFTRVAIDWKETLGTRYVFREVRGDYREAPRALAALVAAARRAGLVIDGPPFALYYDDPAEVPLESLRARVCLPIPPDETRTGPWDVDELASQTVAYAYVGGPRGGVPLAYPALFRYLDERGWRAAGAIREIYLYTPGDAASEPWTEVQVPWRPAGR